MAGIGFVLRRVVAEDTYASVFKGYLAAAVISSGPWFLAVFTLALLGVVASGFLPSEARTLLFTGIVYSFAFSLIVTGIVQTPANRVVADLLYLHKLDQVTPTLAGLLLVVLPVQAGSMMLLFALSNAGIAYAFAIGVLYASVSGIWLTMIFLSAAKRYGAIVWIFFLGYMTSFTGTYVMGHIFGPLGAVSGFALGQSITLVLLWTRALVEFGQPTRISFAVFQYVTRFPSMALIGVLYSLALWIDKIIFWFSSEGYQVQGVLRVYPPYDTATFLAFLTAAPAMALFVTQVETSFYTQYKAFYDALTNKASWGQIQETKKAMSRAIASSYGGLLRMQILIVIAGIAFAPMLLKMVGLPTSPLYMLRISILSVGIHVFLSVTILLLLYFDMRGSTLLVLVVFVVTNVIATLLTLRGGYQWYGFGFLAAEAAATVTAMAALVNRLRRLEYLTFSRQPITEPERLRALLPVQDKPAASQTGPHAAKPQAAPARKPQARPASARGASPAVPGLVAPRAAPAEPPLTASTTILGAMEKVATGRHWVEGVLKEWGVSTEAIVDISLALTEVCTNIVRHGYKGKASGDIKIDLAKQGEVIRTSITDTAPPFVPAYISAPKPSSMAAGGYGLFLIQATMDEVHYERPGETGNRIILVKRDKQSPGKG